jgi:uncharacterized membrane protein
MATPAKLSRPSLNRFLCILVVTFFLIGLLPVPALAEGNGTIAGQVTDNTTAAISDALILVFPQGSEQSIGNATTDVSGNYSLSVVEGNNYQLSAMKEGYITGHIDGQNVTANATTTVNFSLIPGGIIQGVVSDNTSTPIQNASVRAFLPASPGTFYSSQPTNSQGEFSLTAPQGEGYTVTAEKQGYSSANQTGVSAIIGTPTVLSLTLLQPPQQQENLPPAAVTDLASANTTHNSVTLTWTAPGSDNNTGQAFQYDIRFAAATIDNDSKFSSATVATNIPLPHTAGTAESFVVTGLSANTTYHFAMKTRDDINQWSGLSNPVSATTQPPPLTPSFTISHSQDKSSFMLAAGANITETFNVTSVNGFTGNVTLNLGGPPEIANNSTVSPAQVTLSAGQTIPVTLNIGADPMTPSGTYQSGLGGQTTAYGGQERGFFFTIIIGVAGQPLLSASPSIVAAGGQTNFFASNFPASGNITLKWDSGANAGQTIASGTVSEAQTWDTTVTIPAETPVGTFAFKATSGQSSAVFEITVTSGSEPDYIMSTSPQFLSLTPGQSANVTVYVTSVNDFNSLVSLSVGSASGITRSLSTGNVTPGSGETASAVITFTVADWASPNMYQINVEGACADPAINKLTSVNLDIQSAAAWGPGISLSKSYAQVGDTITVTGANFPPSCNGENVTIKEAYSDTILMTNPASIAVSNGGFTGTFTIPSGIPSGNYRIKAIVVSQDVFAERDFQILGTGETFTLGVTPQSVTVTTEAEANSTSTSVNIVSVGGNTPSVNLAIEGAPGWLTYRFGSLADNTPASGDNAVSVPAGGSSSRNLALTASLTAPTGTYSMTVRAWVTGGSEQRVPLELIVQPPAGFNMTQLNLSPTYGESGRTVSFSGTGFTGCTPSQVTELTFGPRNILTGQSLPTINVPTTGDSAGRFSGTFRVPSTLGPGTYPVKIRVGESPNDKFMTKSFTITGGGDTFVLQASPSFLWTEQGQQMTTMIKVQALGSSTPTVNLALEGLPADITASFASTSLTAPPGGVVSTDLNLDIASWMPTGHYSITVKGQIAGGAELHRASLELDIAPPAGMGIASVYVSPTAGSPGTWLTISGSAFPANMPLTHLYFGPPNEQNDQVANGTLPAITTDNNGAFSAVMQVPSGLTPGMYPIEAVVGNQEAERRATADFTLVSDQASFNINLSPNIIQAAPGTSANVSVNVQSMGNTSANVTLRVEGPNIIQWRFDGSEWGAARTVTPAIGSTLMSSLEIRPKASTAMAHYSLAVKAISGEQTEMRNLELDVGASADYSMPILSLNPNTGTAGTNVNFSGSSFPSSANVTRITFGGDNITLAQTITTSSLGAFSGAFTVPATVGGQVLAPGTYVVRITVGQVQAEMMFNVYGSGDTFNISLSPNFLQGGPGTEPRTSGLLKALGGASPTVKMAVKGLPPGVETNWNGTVQSVFSLSAPPGGQNSFELGLVLPNMIAMGQYPAVLEGWVDTNQNNTWDNGENITRVNLELSIMPPEGYGMGILSLNPTYGRVGDTITFTGSGFSGNATVMSLTFAQTDVLSANITTATDGSFSGVFTVPATAFGMDTGPGRYPVDVVVGTQENNLCGSFDFQVVASNQKFSVNASPGWLAQPAGETTSVSINVRSLATTPPSPTIILRVEGLPMGVTPSFTSANVTPPVGGMESRELRLNISSGAPTGNYPISIRTYNAASPSDEMWTDFTLEITPSSDFADMGMATITLSQNYGSTGDRITVSGYGFPKSQSLTHIRLGPVMVTPSVATTTDATGAFSAVITVPSLSSGPHPLEVNVQNTVRQIPFNVMSSQDTFSIKVSPDWLEPIPAGDPNGREIAITVKALPGKTPTVSLSTEGLFAAFGTITETWNPTSKSVTVTNAGSTATATLILKPSADLPPGPYPFNIVASDGSNRRDYHMEFQVGPPASFMDTDWMTQQGVFFPDIFLSPRSGPAGTQVSYTGTNLPAGANVTSISFAGQTVPLPSGGLTADASGGFSGSFIVSEAWNLPPGGMYWVNFHMIKDVWSQDIGKDFNLMRGGAAFSLEATPNWIPPIPPDSFGQTVINVKALGYTSTNVTLAVIENMNGWGIPGGAEAHWNTNDGPVAIVANVPGGGQTAKNFYLKGTNPGHYMITIVGWIDSNDNQLLDKNITSEADSEFSIPLDFEVEAPQEYKTWDMDTMMYDMNMAADDSYLFYFPEIVLNPNTGPAGTKVTITATDFPASANVTYLRFGGMEMPVPSGTVADDDGGFTLVFNAPKTIWNASINPGWYDVEIEAQGTGGFFLNIIKPFQVTGGDVAFTIKADPDWLPPIPVGGNTSTLIRVKSLGSAANVTLSVDRIPAGINTAFSSTEVNVPPGGTASATLTLTPQNIPPGHYFAEIKGTATVSGSEKTFFAHLEFDVETPQEYRNWDMNTMMTDMNMAATDKYLFYFPEITLNPNMGQAGTKVTIQATDFPAGANVTLLRFADKYLPVPAGTVADNITGNFTLVFNVPKTLWSANITAGWYDVQVEAMIPNEPPVSIMKPFQVTTGDVAFTMRAEPNWLPPIPPAGSGTTNILINSTGAGADVTLSVDKIPPGVNTAFSSTQVNAPPGGSRSVTLTLTPTTIPSGHYGAEIKGTATISGVQKTFYTHIEFEVQPPQSFMNWDRDAMITDMNMTADDMYLFYFPEITLNPNMGQAGTKVTIQATDFPTGANVTLLRFADKYLPVPAGTVADNVTGDFTLVFNVPKTLWNAPIGPGWYDVEVEAMIPDEPPVFIMKPFQVTTGDVAFTLRAEPNWLPPIPPEGSTTTIRVTSMGAGADVTLSVDKIPPGITTAFSSTQVNVPPGGSSTATLTLTPTTIAPGYYGAEIKGTATVSGVQKTFYTHIEFDVKAPDEFTNWDRDAMMTQMNMTTDDKYLLYFPEITLNPNMGQAGTKVTIKATDFPASANVTHLRFAGMELPVPAGTAADNITGDFDLVFNVPKTLWSANITSGWYDVEVEAMIPDEPSVFIMKPFQVTAGDVAFTLKAEPDWLPPIPPAGSTTTIRVTSMGAAANVTLSMNKIPSGINASFSSTQVNVPPGGSGSSVLTLTPTTIAPGYYGAEIKGTATISGVQKTFYTHIEFDVEPSQEFKDVSWMEQQGIWFPEITLNPNTGPVKTKVSVKATDFPAGATVTHLRFAGRELPVPDNTTAGGNGDLTLVFNVPSDYGVGQYMVEVEAQKTGMQMPVFIAKPFFIQDAGVTFKLDVVPGFVPGVAQGESGNTTVFVKATGQAVTVDLYVDGLPPGVTGTFGSSSITVPPGGSSSTSLTITTRASTPTGYYPLTIRGVKDGETRMVPFGFGVMPPANFQMPEFTLSPDYAPASYYDKQYKITFSGTGFPGNKSVASLNFGAQAVAIPANLTTDTNGNFNGVFQMPTGLTPGTYDVRVAVADGSGGYLYDSRPFSIRGAQAKFILKLSPPYLPPVLQGGQGTTMVNVQSVGTTAANVTLSVDGLAPGITAAFTPGNIVAVTPGSSGSATLTINVSTSTPPGDYPLSIRGSSGSESVAVPLGFSVMPDIGGGEGHATVTINPAQARPGEHIGISGAGFTSNSTITLTAAPPGAPQAISITPGVITVQSDGTWATEITVPPANQVPPGTYIIKASDGVMASKNYFSIVPATNADFFLTVSPQFIEVVKGQSGNTTMKLSSKNGFQEPVVFGVGHLAPGVTATFKNAAGTTISKFTGAPGGIRETVAPVEQTPVPGEDLIVTVLIDVDVDTPLGPYDVALEAGSGTVYRAIPLGFMVTSTGANMVISPQSGPVDTDIRLSGSGFTAGETLTVKFAGSNITTVPGTITVAQDGTFTAVITAPANNAGIYPVRVTGGTSGITIDRPFSLKPSAVNTFVLYASPMKVDIPKGGSGTVTAKIEPLGNFQSAITLSTSGLNAISGATANISPSSTITPSIATPTTATLTLNVPAGATVGKYPLVLTGTSGNITQTRNITLNVVPPAGTADFGISLAPNTIPISPSSSSNTTVMVTAINGFTGTVNLAVAMSNANATWPDSITYTAGSVTPSTNTGMGKQSVVFTAAADTQPGNWTFRITGTSGALSHSTDVMVICTPSGTTVTPYASPRLDPTTVTPSTPIDMTAPWGDKITINGIINDGSEASIITPSNVEVAPDTLADLPEGATDMLGRITNIESSAPVDGAEWNIGFPYNPAALEAAGLEEENLKVAYLNPDTGTWTEMTTTVDTTNHIAYASPSHFSSWTLLATTTPPPSEVVTTYGGGGGGAMGLTSVTDSVTPNGTFIKAVTAASYDKKVTVSVPMNTVGKDEYGKALYAISIQEKTSYPTLPPDTSLIGQVYDLWPSGATFDPPISVTFKYDDSQVPFAYNEEDLVIATWQDNKWSDLADCTIDAAGNTITTPISHFSYYTVMAHTAAAKFEITTPEITPDVIVDLDQNFTISTTVTNTGDLSGSYKVTLTLNGSVADTQEVSLAGHASQKVNFTLKLDKAGSYAVDINGLTGTFTVREEAAPPEEEAVPEEEAAPAEVPETEPVPTEITPSAPEAKPAPPEEPVKPSEVAPTVPEAAAPKEAETAPQRISDWLIFVIVTAVGAIIVGLVFWRMRAGRKTS